MVICCGQSTPESIRPSCVVAAQHTDARRIVEVKRKLAASSSVLGCRDPVSASQLLKVWL